MAATTVDDPIRDEVERVLHALVDATLVVPRAALSAATVVPRCVVRRACRLTRRLGEPLRVARSLFDLAGAGSSVGVLAPDDAPRPDEPVAPLGADARSALGANPTSDDVALPIEEYESLAASQVVARLPSLRADDLVILRDFEAAHRGRRTILGKIDQLLA